MESRVKSKSKIHFSMILLFNGHAGLVFLCGKAIQLNLIKKFENLKLKFSTWLNFTANNSLEEVILDYPTFRKLVRTLVKLDLR